MMEFKQYTAIELLKFTQSAEFRNSDIIPVSVHRAVSYLHNPHLHENDIVAIIAFDNGQIAGFRTLLPDIFGSNEKTIRFAWLSGNWVRSSYRRKGLSTQLYKIAARCWKNQVAYTNYAPESKMVYDSTGDFTEIFQKEGQRYYFRACFSNVLKKRKYFKKLPVLLKITDLIANIIIVPLNFFRILPFSQKNVDYQYSTIDDPEIMQFIKENSTSSGSDASYSRLQWIIHYPWIFNSPFLNKTKVKYPFTANSKNAYSLIIKFFSFKKLSAVVFLQVSDKKIKVPYYFISKDYSIKPIANVLLWHCHQCKVDYLTVFDHQLCEAISAMPAFYIYRKKQIQRYFAHQILADELTKKQITINFSDGDGDCAFT